jgi:hypothetical protein
MFAAASLMLINKIDLLPYLSFDVEQAIDFALRVNPHLQVIQVSPPPAPASMPGWAGSTPASPKPASSRRNGRATARPDRALEAALDAERLRKSEFMLIVVDPTRVARRLRVRGWSRVGFRPFVYRLPTARPGRLGA